MVAKSLAIISVILALVGYLVLGTGSTVAVPSLTDETETPISTSTPDSTATPTGEATPVPVRLSGLVTLNLGVAPPGIGLRVLNDKEALCGETVTQPGGRFEIILGSACPINTDVTFQLSDIAGFSVSFTLSAETQDVIVEFEDLTTSDLLALGAKTEPQAVEDAVADVVAAAEGIQEAQGTDPVLSQKMSFGLAIITIVGAFILLGLLAKLKYRGRATAGLSFQKEIEALILILVLAAVLLFGMSGRLATNGIIAILSLIAGFALGQYASSASGAIGAGGASGAGGAGGTGGSGGAGGGSGATGASGAAGATGASGAAGASGD